MDPKSQALYNGTATYHKKAYASLQEIEQAIKSCNDLEELADYVFAMREIYERLEDTRKHVKKLQELATVKLCVKWLAESDGDTVKTWHVSVTPKLGIHARVPKRDDDPESYAALMDHLGIAEGHPVREMEVMRIHWPGWTTYLANLAENGKAPPACIGEQTPVYSATCRRKHDVSENPSP